MKNKILSLSIKILVIISFISVVLVNYLANSLPINGLNTGQLSDMYPNLFVPTGLTFSIWGVIYLFLLAYTVYQTEIFSPSGINNIRNDQRVLFIFSCVLNVSWIFCWHYLKIFYSVVVMILLLITLIIIYLKTRPSINSNFKDKLLISETFSIYLGWITVATIANITTYLVSIKWNGWGISGEIWTSLLILIAVALTIMVQMKYKDILYSAVILWAFLGILIKHITDFKYQYPLVIVTACAAMLILSAGITFLLFKAKRKEVSSIKYY